MAFPRVSALAEAIWCRERGSFDEFEERLGAHLVRLLPIGIDAYRRTAS
ncbi:hypothetical protein [Glaciibacter sp. 2TAF33]